MTLLKVVVRVKMTVFKLFLNLVKDVNQVVSCIRTMPVGVSEAILGCLFSIPLSFLIAPA